MSSLAYIINYSHTSVESSLKEYKTQLMNAYTAQRKRKGHFFHLVKKMYGQNFFKVGVVSPEHNKLLFLPLARGQVELILLQSAEIDIYDNPKSLPSFLKQLKHLVSNKH